MKGESIRLRPMHSCYYMLVVLFLIAVSSDLCAVAEDHLGELKGGGRGLKENSTTIGSSAFTFDCSPSGPCIPCLYHEKKLETFRCSETGYRIPIKCVKSPLDNNNHHKRLLEDSSSEVYTSYRSCIPAVNQEKLSLLAFEGIMLLLLLSSSYVIFRRKGTLFMPGPIRLPTNPRF